MERVVAHGLFEVNRVKNLYFVRLIHDLAVLAAHRLRHGVPVLVFNRFTVFADYGFDLRCSALKQLPALY